MHLYLINLDRRPDRLATMMAQAQTLGLVVERIAAVDGRSADPAELERWFTASGPLGVLSAGDKACFLSHRMAWAAFLASGEAHAVVVEDDVRLCAAARSLLTSDAWVPEGAQLIKLEHYGPQGQRVLLRDFRPVTSGFALAQMLSRHTGTGAYLIGRAAAHRLLAQTCVSLPVDHLMFNPNNSPLFASLAPQQLVPAIARQEDFVGIASDIESARKPLRTLSLTYARREVIRFGYDLKCLPRQIAALIGGARFSVIKTAD